MCFTGSGLLLFLTYLLVVHFLLLISLLVHVSLSILRIILHVAPSQAKHWRHLPTIAHTWLQFHSEAADPRCHLVSSTIATGSSLVVPQVQLDQAGRIRMLCSAEVGAGSTVTPWCQCHLLLLPRSHRRRRPTRPLAPCRQTLNHRRCCCHATFSDPFLHLAELPHYTLENGRLGQD